MSPLIHAILISVQKLCINVDGTSTGDRTSLKNWLASNDKHLLQTRYDGCAA